MQSVVTGGISDAVADTLFITLYMRCLEHRRPDGIIRDSEACRIVDAVDYDFSKYNEVERSQLGTCIRTRHFDDVARHFIENNDNPVVICLGCGLDNRAHRVGSDSAVFYNIDLPEVMEVRDQLIEPDERNISIHDSMFNRSWIDRIRADQPGGAFLLMAEGVFMFFLEDEIRSMVMRIANLLSPSEFVFDACSSFGCKMSSKHETIRFTNASFKWGLDDDHAPERWMQNLRLTDVSYYMDKEKDRWGLMTRAMSLVPFFFKAFKMLHYKQEAQAVR